MSISTKLQRGDSLVIATHNTGKLTEFRELFEPFGVTLLAAGDLGVPEPEETGETFEDNARIKAVISAFATGKLALADDSGLAVDALEGAPGIHSARWAGEPRDFRVGMQRIEDELQAKAALSPNQRRAHFICVLCLANQMGDVQFFEGKVSGHVVWPPRGHNGFGYDPIFVPEGHDQTFGQMEPAQKYELAHRTKAFNAFRAAFLQR